MSGSGFFYAWKFGCGEMPIEYWTGALAGWPLIEPLEPSVSRSPGRFIERARGALLIHLAGRKNGQASGGMVPGSRVSGETRIARTLPCANAAPPEETEGTFRIDPPAALGGKIIRDQQR